MPKSLGNGIDPLEIVDEYGADALRFTLAYMGAQGQDILMDKESFKLGSKFANKIWNASRYILMNLEGSNLIEKPGLLPVDKWIYSRLNTTARKMEEAFISYRFNDAAQTVYEYFWNDFCDWYVEASKLSIKGGDDADKDRATTVLLDVLAQSLRLLHPLLPFITEEIYAKLPNVKSGELLITASYPVYNEEISDTEVEQDFALLQELVRQIRTLRSECTIPPDRKLKVLLRVSGRESFLKDNSGLVKLLAGIGELETPAVHGGASGGCSEPIKAPSGSIGLAGNEFEAFVFIAEAADMKFLKEKFAKELERDSKFIESRKAKLANENFIKNAPPELVAGEKQKLEDSLSRKTKLESYMRDMA
jgi:valyl-tRNA synthetase